LTTTLVGSAQERIRAVYDEAVYDVGELGEYFVTLDETWSHFLLLAALRTGEEDDPETRVTKIQQLLDDATIYFEQDATWSRWQYYLMPGEGELPSDDAIKNLSRQRPTVRTLHKLTFERIRLSSPLDITIAAQAAGGTGIVLYGLYLLRAFLRDPERLGAWLPRLVKGWHLARRDAERARQDHQEEVVRGRLADILIEQSMSKLIDLAQHPELQTLHPVEVTLLGADEETPADIGEAFNAEIITHPQRAPQQPPLDPEGLPWEPEAPDVNLPQDESPEQPKIDPAPKVGGGGDVTTSEDWLPSSIINPADLEDGAVPRDDYGSPEPVGDYGNPDDQGIDEQNIEREDRGR
jgi:hypothetical protein